MGDLLWKFESVFLVALPPPGALFEFVDISYDMVNGLPGAP